jgi:hypothetical protein
MLTFPGADGMVVDSYGRAPIYWATLCNHTSIMSLLPKVKYDWYKQMLQQPILHPIPIRLPKERPPKDPKKMRRRM